MPDSVRCGTCNTSRPGVRPTTGLAPPVRKTCGSAVFRRGRRDSRLIMRAPTRRADGRVLAAEFRGQLLDQLPDGADCAPEQARSHGRNGVHAQGWGRSFQLGHIDQRQQIGKRVQAPGGHPQARQDGPAAERPVRCHPIDRDRRADVDDHGGPMRRAPAGSPPPHRPTGPRQPCPAVPDVPPAANPRPLIA